MLGAPGFQSDEFLELVTPGHQRRQGRFPFAGRGVARGLHDGSEGAEHRRVERVGLGQAALGTGKGTHAGGVVDADAFARRLQGTHHGALVAARTLADDVGRSVGLGLHTGQVGEQGAVARRGVGQREWTPGQINLEGELGHV